MKAPPQTTETLYDQRLFNQSEGLDRCTVLPLCRIFSQSLSVYSYMY
jgi:hypothetical protein